MSKRETAVNESNISASPNSISSSYSKVDEQVFIDRQKEICLLSKKFGQAVDKMLEEKPINYNINGDEEEEYEYYEEEEEEEEICDFNGEALIIIHEIDLLSQDINQILNGLSPKLANKNTFVKRIILQLNNLLEHMETLRIRAENLLSEE